MAKLSSSFYRDANRVPVWTDGLITKKTITFAGATTNAWGDDAGTRDGGVLFTVTGLVYASVIGICTTDTEGATSTEEVGITGATAIFMPITTMTNLEAGEIWFNNATPATYTISGGATPADRIPPEYILNGNDIIMTTKTANTDSGVVDFYCIWRPISSDCDVVASTI